MLTDITDGTDFSIAIMMIIIMMDFIYTMKSQGASSFTVKLY